METAKTQKLVDFENPIFKALLARQLNVKESNLKHFVLPSVGDTITLGNVIYRITYIRENPYRYTAEPVGILTDEEFEKSLVESTKQTDSEQCPNPCGEGESKSEGLAESDPHTA